MKAAFHTLGCKVNQYETQILLQQFASAGFEIVSAEEKADVYIVNSCTVTSFGDKKSRQMLRRFKRRNPDAVVALTGCYPQAFPDIARHLPEADVITGTRERSQLLVLVQKAIEEKTQIVQISPHLPNEPFEPMQATSFLEHTRAFVKIEDGCERYCSYCIIPKARGFVRSKPLKDLKQELYGLAEKGFREVVLVGINLSCYGKELGLRLIDAVRLACSVPGIERVRLGSLEPEMLTAGDIAELAALPKFCPQFHLSLQSGCDETLRRMNRHYTAAEYADIVKNLRHSFENPAITTDVMVGFPGETQEEFEASLKFCQELSFAKAHVFIYSPRPGTPAARREQLAAEIKEKRSERMIAACEEKRAEFLQSQVGRTEEVLFETALPGGEIEGYTKNYVPVRISEKIPLCGEIRSVKLTGMGKDWCTGELTEQ